MCAGPFQQLQNQPCSTASCRLFWLKLTDPGSFLLYLTGTHFLCSVRWFCVSSVCEYAQGSIPGFFSSAHFFTELSPTQGLGCQHTYEPVTEIYPGSSNSFDSDSNFPTSHPRTSKQLHGPTLYVLGVACLLIKRFL